MKFVQGETYFTHSICDSEMVISVTISKRTPKQVTTTDGKTFRITIYNGIEQIRPWGRYSMSPIISADDILKEVKQKSSLNSFNLIEDKLINNVIKKSNIYNMSDYRK